VSEVPGFLFGVARLRWLLRREYFMILYEIVSHKK